MDNDMSMVEELPIYILPRCIVKFLNNTVDGNGDADGKILCSCTVKIFMLHVTLRDILSYTIHNLYVLQFPSLLASYSDHEYFNALCAVETCRALIYSLSK